MGLFFFYLSLKALSSAVCADALPNSGLFFRGVEDPIAYFAKSSSTALANLIVKRGADADAG